MFAKIREIDVNSTPKLVRLTSFVNPEFAGKTKDGELKSIEATACKVTITLLSICIIPRKQQGNVEVRPARESIESSVCGCALRVFKANHFYGVSMRLMIPSERGVCFARTSSVLL